MPIGSTSCQPWPWSTYSARASNFCGSPALVGPCQLQDTSVLNVTTPSNSTTAERISSPSGCVATDFCRNSTSVALPAMPGLALIFARTNAPMSPVSGPAPPESAAAVAGGGAVGDNAASAGAWPPQPPNTTNVLQSATTVP